MELKISLHIEIQRNSASKVFKGKFDFMDKYDNVIHSLFQVYSILNEWTKTPRDYGTGDLLYSTEIHTIAAIGESTEINLTELARKLNVSKSACSKFIKKLLAKDYIVKKRFPANQKEVLFSLTATGEIACAGHKEFSAIKFKKVHAILNHYKDDAEVISSFMAELAEGLKE